MSSVSRIRKGEYHITIPEIKHTHVDWFLQKRCAPDIIAHQLFPNTKEISESAAVVRNALKYVNDNDVTHCIVVGDGTKPRTAAMMAYMTREVSVVSVDPMLHTDWTSDKYKLWIWGIQRLTTYKSTIEEWIAGSFTNPVVDHLMILAVHSHAKMDNYVMDLRKLFPKAKTTVISLECCVQQTIDGFPPNQQYEDYAVYSEKRTMKIWKFIPTQEEPTKDDSQKKESGK